VLQFVKPACISRSSILRQEDFKDRRALLSIAPMRWCSPKLPPLFPAAGPSWTRLPARLLRKNPSVTQREGEPLPEPLHVLVQRMLEGPASVSI